MKKLLFLILIGISTLFSFGQENFKWNKIDTTSLTKNELYLITKSFIAEKFVSANAVIQNDDKEAGVIILSVRNIQEVKYSLALYTYVYSYNVIFKFKDGKYNLIIDNVYCINSYFSGTGKIGKIQPFEGEENYPRPSFSNPNIPTHKAVPMMNNLKKELQDLFDSYVIYLKDKNDILSW